MFSGAQPAAGLWIRGKYINGGAKVWVGGEGWSSGRSKGERKRKKYQSKTARFKIRVRVETLT